MSVPSGRIAAFVATLLVSAAALAQAPDRPPKDDQLLRGPPVDPVETTIVSFDFQGNFVPVEGRPEGAALRTLLLDPERREQLRAIAEARLMRLSTLLVERIDLVKEITDAIRGGDPERAQVLQRRLYDEFESPHARDPLLEPVAELLTAGEQATVRGLLDEYWRVWIDWELREQPDKSEPARRAAQDRLAYSLFQGELQRAYSYSLQRYRQLLETVYAVVEPTDEQRSAIREVVLDVIREGGLETTPEQRRRAARRIYDLLDEERRLKLFEYGLWRR